jgi:hypothetical protein
MSDITAIDKKVCSSLNCQKVATRHLKIKFSHRTGFFCKEHADEFLSEGIVEAINVLFNPTRCDYDEGNIK